MPQAAIGEGHPMRMLSEDDLSWRELSDDELMRAWDLWFELAQVTNDSDPAYSHGVFAGVEGHSAPGPIGPPGPDQAAAIPVGDEAL